MFKLYMIFVGAVFILEWETLVLPTLVLIFLQLTLIRQRGEGDFFDVGRT